MKYILFTAVLVVAVSVIDLCTPSESCCAVVPCQPVLCHVATDANLRSSCQVAPLFVDQHTQNQNIQNISAGPEEVRVRRGIWFPGKNLLGALRSRIRGC